MQFIKLSFFYRMKNMVIESHCISLAILIYSGGGRLDGDQGKDDASLLVEYWK